MFIDDRNSLVSTVLLGDLPGYDYVVHPTIPVRKVAKKLESTIELPGVIIKEGDKYLGMISRRMCFEKLSIQYGTELYLHKPIWNLYRSIGFSPILLPHTYTVEQAVKLALFRSPDQRYEPIIVEFPDQQYRMVDLHVILLTQSQLHARANHLVSKLIEMGRDLSSTLHLQEVIDLILKFIAEIVPYEYAEVMLNTKGALKQVASRGEEMELVKADNDKDFYQNLYQDMISSKNPILLPSSNYEYPQNVDQISSQRAWMGIPLFQSENVVGLLTLNRQKSTPFDDYELILVQSFACQAAIAIQNAQLYEEVKHLATIDPLTRLVNRRHLFQMAGYELEKAIRYKRPLSLIMIDVDHFKRINDRFGHPTGDYVLQSIAERFLNSMREVDILGRYGGEEFLVVLPEIPVQIAHQVAERLREMISNTSFKYSNQEFWITTSMGVTGYDKQGEFIDLDTLLDQADQALYRAKAAGRNCSVVWDQNKVDETVCSSLNYLPFHNNQHGLMILGNEYLNNSKMDSNLLVKQEYSALRTQLNILTTALNTIEDAVVVMDSAGEIHWVNQAFTHYTGFTPEEVLGGPVNFLYHGQNEENFFQSMIVSLSNGLNWQGRMLCKQKTGGNFCVNVSTHPVLDNTGHPLFHVIVKKVVSSEHSHVQSQNLDVLNVRQRLSDLKVMTRVANEANSARGIDTLLPQLLDESLRILNSQAGAIFLYNNKKGLLEKVTNRGWLNLLTSDGVQLDNGILGQVFSSGKIYVTEDFLNDPNTFPENRNLIPGGWGGVCVPLNSFSGIIGVLLVAIEQPLQLSDQDLGLIKSLAEIIANATQNINLRLSSEKQLKRLVALKAIDNSISGNKDINMVLSLLLDQVISQLGVEAAAILMANHNGSRPKYTALRGFPDHIIDPLLKNQTEIDNASLNNLQVIKNVNGIEFILTDGTIEEYGGYIETPLVVKEKLIGTLQLFHHDPIQTDNEWLDFLEILAAQAAIVIHNAQLVEELRRMNDDISLAYDTTIESWDRMLELRDQETVGHTHRVVEKTMELGKAMGFSGEELKDMRRGALLHDVGKVGIPDRILQKPGPLDENEWEVIKQHPVYVYEMLSGIEFLEKALEIPYCHHEKWDGSGYPRGLKGEEIPLSARIFAVVDVWDALCSDRPYRNAWSEQKVFEYIREQAGIHFDPDVVRVFLSLN